MGESRVQLSLPQMVDLALGSPEVGVVNFNILHSLLHVLIQQVDLLGCKVEFKGDTSERVQTLIKTTPQAPAVSLTEYIVTPENEQHKVISKKARYKKVETKGNKEEGLFEQDLQVAEQSREPKQQTEPKQQADQVSWAESVQTVVVVETGSAISTPHTSVAISKANLSNLEKELNDLRKEVEELKGLPSSLGIIDAIRSKETDSQLVDMFQFLTITKRMDAFEGGIHKLAAVVEDLARERATGTLFPDQALFNEEGMSQSSGQEGGVGQSVGTGASGNINEWMRSVDTRLKALEGTTDAVGGSPGKLGQTATTKEGTTEGVGGSPTKLGQTPTATEGTTEAVGGASRKLGGTATTKEGQTEAEGGSPRKLGQSEEAAGEKQADDLESKFKEYADYINSMDSSFNSQIDALQQHLTDLEKEIGEIVERINAQMPAGDNTVEGDMGVQEMYKKMLAMQTEMDHLSATAATLLTEKDNRQTHMDALLEQIEMLKTVKANREDLEDALANKADACAVNKKVSHDQFDAACDDMARNIELALVKLREQETLWSQALEDIQTEIEHKLDKMELTPLRDFVHNKLKMLQDRLKALAALKQDTEAAGTKSKFLRNVNCISCDKDVVMRREMDPTQLPAPAALPPTKSIGPYLAYELDQLRKEQKCAPYGRNMNHFEIALNSTKGDRHHICNRYCGGSHTLTTPQQRVARVGHFLQQWGSESAFVHEGEVRGMDGHMYKARNVLDVGQAVIDSSVNPKPSMLISSIISNRVSDKKADALIENAVPALKTK
ncbi:uncharacterized protein LOC116178381 isoform X2 [Photinus pyralis]|uniref:uncharacterized protein LOC116178381 isoform X2 n=1 Tax=Photinus pyralis TaxID=7054 RepID=UPI001267329D|nr:uncharacterized protein LOC116178381 isoform X2 [Photinus pyralis]